jgi:hypothetical protein
VRAYAERADDILLRLRSTPSARFLRHDLALVRRPDAQRRNAAAPG